MQKLRFVNGNGVEIDLTSGNYGITAISGLSNANLNLQTQQVPNNDGSVYIDSLLDNRTIDMTVALNDENNLEKRYQLRRELISALNPKLGEGYLYYKNDFLERRIKVIPNPPVIKNKNSNEKGTVKASVSFTACGVYWEDVEETVVELNSFEEKTVVNNGDVPCAVKVEGFNVKSPFLMINNSSGKKINIQNDVSGILTVDFNLGQKSIDINSLVEKQIFAEFTDIKSVLFNSILNRYIIVDNHNVFVYSDFETESIVLSGDFKGGYFDETSGKVYVYGPKGIYTSTDCETWINEVISDVVYLSKFNGKFIITINSNTLITYVTSNLTYYPSPIFHGEIPVYIGPMFGPGTYVIIFSYGTYAYTDDFETFNTASLGLNRVSAVACDGSKLLITDPNEEDYMYGVFYTTALNGPDTQWTAVVQDDPISFCFYSKMLKKFYYWNNLQIYSSDDCVSWDNTPYTLSASPFGVIDIPQLNLCLLWTSNTVNRTEDFKTFETLIQNELSISNVYTKNICVTDGFNLFNFVYESHMCVIMKYNTGNENFEIISTLNNIEIRNVKYLEEFNKFVILADSNIYLSSDCIEWTKLETSYNFNDCIYNDNLFIAVGENGRILVSSDMVTIEYKQTSNTDELYTIVYSKGEEIYYIGGSGEYWTTPDFITFLINGLGHSYKSSILYKGSVYFIYDNFDIISLKNSVPTVYHIFSGVQIYNFYFSKYLNAFVLTTSLNILCIVKEFTQDNTLKVYYTQNFKTGTLDLKNNIYGYGDNSVSIYKLNKVNAISQLTPNSDMSFYLIIGNNKISITGQIAGVYYLTYRQKYLGV